MYGEGKQREATCTNVRSNAMVRVNFTIRAGPAWELGPSPLIRTGDLCPAMGHIRIMMMIEYAKFRSRLNTVFYDNISSICRYFWKKGVYRQMRKEQILKGFLFRFKTRNPKHCIR